MGTNKDIEELTEADFRAYEQVRAGGRWNMVTDASSAMRDAGLGEAAYWGVLWNYSELAKKFGKAKA